MRKLKVNDDVVVVAGKEKGKTGKVSHIDWKNDKVLIKEVNLVKKTMRPTKENPNGGVFSKEAPVHISNVMLISPKTKKPTRVRIEMRGDKRVRVCVECKSELK